MRIHLAEMFSLGNVINKGFQGMTNTRTKIVSKTNGTSGTSDQRAAQYTRSAHRDFKCRHSIGHFTIQA